MSFICISPENNTLEKSLNYISKTEFEKSLPSLPHLHHFTEIMIVTGGEGYFVSKEVFYPVKKGCVIIIRDGLMHTESAKNNSSFEYYTIGLNNISFNINKTVGFIFKPKEHFSTLLNAVTILFKELKDKDDGYTLICRNMLESILILTERISSFKKMQKKENVYDERLKSVIEFIDSNYNEMINLDSLCEIAYVSRPHLIRLFKKYTTLSPMQYVLKRKISAAKTMLLTTELSISEIAMMLNFPSISNFILKFKNRVELTPLQYRIKHTKHK